MHLEDLIGSPVRLPEGGSLGHVVDVYLTGLPKPEIVGLAVGPRAWLPRLHLHTGLSGVLMRARRVQVVRWSAVAGYRDFAVHLKRGWRSHLREVSVEDLVG